MTAISTTNPLEDLDISTTGELDAFSAGGLDDLTPESGTVLDTRLSETPVPVLTKVRQPFAVAYEGLVGFMSNATRFALTVKDVATAPVGKGFGTRSRPGENRRTLAIEARQRLSHRLLTAADEYASSLFPADPRLKDDFLLTKAPAAIASTANFLALTVLTRGLGGSALTRSMAIGGSVNSIDALDRAIAEGRPSSEIANIFDGSFLIGTAEGIVIPRILSRIGGDRFIANLTKSSFENSFQEATQKALQNVLEGKPMGEGVAEDALLGAIAGGGTLSIAEAGVRTARRITRGAPLEQRFAQAVEDSLGQTIRDTDPDIEALTQSVDDARFTVQPNADVRAKLGLIIEQADKMLTTEGDIDLLGELSQSLQETFRSEAQAEFLKGVPESVITEFERINRAVIRAREAVAKQRFELQDRIAQLEEKLLDDPRNAKLEAGIAALQDQIDALRSKPDKKFVARIRKATQALFAADDRAAQSSLAKTVKSIDLETLSPKQRTNIEGVVTALDASKPTDKTLEGLDGTLRALAQNPDSIVPGSVVDGLRRIIKTPVRDLSAQDARVLEKAILHAKHLDTVKKQIKERLESGQRDTDSLEVAAEMASAQSILKTNPTFASGQAQARQKEGFLRLVTSRIGNSTLDTLASLVGGGDGSTAHKVLAQDVIDSFDTALDAYYEGVDARDQAIRDVGLDPGGDDVASWSAEIADVRGRLIHNLTFGATTPTTKAQVDLFTDHTGKTVGLTAAQRMQIVAMAMDAETHDIMLFHKNKDGSRGLPLKLRRVAPTDVVTPSQTGATRADSDTITLNAQTLAQMRNSLSAQQLAVTGAMVRHLNGPMREMVRKWSLDAQGVDITKDGTWFPRHRVRVGRQIAEATAASFTQSAVETAGILQERSGGDAPLQIRDIFVEYSDVLYAASAATQMGPAISAAKTMLDSEPVSEVLNRSRNGSRVRTAFNRFYDAAAAQVVGRSNTSTGIANSAVRSLIDRVTRSFLTFNPKVATYQVVSVAMLKSEMSARDVGQAQLEMAMFDASVDERVNAKSSLRFRSEGSNVGRVNETSEGGAKFGGQINARSRAEERGFRMIGAMDNSVIRVAWVAAEIQAARELGVDDRMSQEVQSRAGEIALRAVNRTQPTFDPLSITGIGVEAKQSGLLKALTMFRAQRSKNVDITIRRLSELNANPTAPNARRAAKDIATIWVFNSMRIAAIQEAFSAMFRLGKPPEDDEDSILVSFLRRVNATAFGNLILGDLFTSASDAALTTVLELADFDTRPQFDPSISPLASVAEGVFVKTRRRLARVEDAQEALVALERAVEDFAPVVGIPVTPLRMGRQIIESIERDARRGGGGSAF